MIETATCRSCQRDFPANAGHRCGEGDAEAALRKTLSDRDLTIERLTRELTSVREAWTKERAGYDETTRVLGEKAGRAMGWAESFVREATKLMVPCSECGKAAEWSIGSPFCDVCRAARGALPGVHHDVKPHKQALLLELMKAVAPEYVARDAEKKNIAYLQANIAEVEGMLTEMPESMWIERIGFESLLEEFKGQLATAMGTQPSDVEAP
jgi:hypothetical protein